MVTGLYTMQTGYHEPFYSYCDGYKDSIRKPAARVVSIEHSTPANDNSNTHIVHWDAANKHSFVVNVTYKNGRFAIVQKGYYYIYSQVTFKESNITDKPYTSLCHFIFKIKPNGNGEYTEKLLESSQSKCQLQSQTSNSTSYIGAVFYLAENDKVQVKVTHPEKTTKSPHSNYFGLHMI
ncbi:hypothetical protein KUTeg_011995 [Tegillarca granosa]|uniref:THD domain-containing protein n=1 Tax=Tegillarca granosa TaxID=220873 RepID=A0ABQ9EYA4_TEGGR|nr:hypothetical protein KUTeg_011995 [Tegillarca granosa]